MERTLFAKPMRSIRRSLLQQATGVSFTASKPLCQRLFSNTSTYKADGDSNARSAPPTLSKFIFGGDARAANASSPYSPPSSYSSSSLHARASRSEEASKLSDLSAVLAGNNYRDSNTQLSSLLDVDRHLVSSQEQARKIGGTVWHLHVYVHKHNTHITLSRPNNQPAISLSCGNIGFRNSSKKLYEAGFQLAIHAFNQIRDANLLPQIKELELIYRGFGKGREAVTKVLLGAEGIQIRKKIVKVSDATKLKFGGTRSKNLRRV